jgi:16S rRNA (cytosine1402-N4)-methyltransferase
MDVDPQALTIARQRLAPFGERVVVRQASYTTLAEQLVELDWLAVDGVLLDLGVSSMQLDTPERGFSFMSDAPLDMRFGPHLQQSAADLINSLPEASLADIIFRYGEERYARQVARAIVRSRPLHTTKELADLVLSVLRHRSGRESGKIHPATRTFQALRIAVNGELSALEQVLPEAVSVLKPGGRLAVIAFHSLEDRIVKAYFHRESMDCICPARQPICTCGHKATVIELNRRPIQASQAEVNENPRARSARLRVVQRIGNA